MHTEPFYRLPLFFEDRNDIDAATATQSHQDQLHRPHPEIGAAAVGAVIDLHGMTKCVPGFKSIITLYPFHVYFYHGKDFCKCNSCGPLLCTLNLLSADAVLQL